jgi:hypothetical protein
VPIFSIFILLLTTLGTPQSAAISPSQAETENSKDSMVVPACRQKGDGLRRVGGGKYGLQFDVPVREVEVLGGKPDVDYVRYVIKAKGSDGYVEFWFGPYAMSSSPEQELLLTSAKVQKRGVVDASGSEVGRDYSGKLKTGELWRHTLIMLGGMDGARYKAGPENAALFDRIINSACYAQQPKS